MTTYRVIRDDLTGMESWAAVPAPRHVACHRCGDPSGGTWYCGDCQAHLSRRDWLPILAVGAAAWLVLTAVAVLMVLRAAS